MIRIRDLRLDPGQPLDSLKKQAADRLGVHTDAITDCSLFRRSVDARKKPDVFFVCTVDVCLSCDEEAVLKRLHDPKIAPAKNYRYELPLPAAQPKTRPVVVGFGPAGMFAALTLARAGLKPLVLERGAPVEARTEAVRRFWEQGKLDPESNVQFGEGGAGTFSDGKLTTGTKDPRIRHVFEEFVRFGAQEDILWDAKPHIGTDVLCRVVKNFREELLSLGAEIRFGTKLTELCVEDGALTAIRCGEETIPCSVLILAIGHSARDTFRMLHQSGVPMEPKPFSIGVRIEHPQATIDEAQYGKARGSELPAADYKLNVVTPSGSAYTFCMCPGGSVVAAASEEGGVCTNGMSNAARDGENANSALLVTLTPKDFPDGSPLSGMEWQREIEQRAFKVGGSSYRAPAQSVGDFLKHRPSEGFAAVRPTYLPGVTPCDLHDVLPNRLTDVLEEALPLLGNKIRGFDAADAVMTAPETRSSSPVRMLRDAESLQSSLKGLYPCGEGAGHAGGIVSSAVDGIRCAEALIKNI